MSRLLRMNFWLSLLALLFCSLPGGAQINTSTGAIKGVVTDPQNAAAPGATVILSNTDTGVVTAQVKTNSDGSFVFPLLPPGNYKLEISDPGFQSAVLPGISVEVTKVTVANVKLQLGQVSAAVTVAGAAEAVDTTSATTGDVITGTQIRSIPLATRSFLDLVSMQAGVAAAIQSAAPVGKGAPTVYVAGQRSTMNNLVLDGIDANDWHGNGLTTVPVPSPDALQEFRVSTSQYDASQGRASGGEIDVVLRSGTDQMHGGLFEFNRNTDYNANDFFRNAAGAARPVLQQNQFGGTVGGPIPKLKKKVFWFFSYQGTQQLNGVSSSVTGPQPVLPDRTGQTAGSYTSELSAAFKVPAASIDPVAVNLLLAPGPYSGYLFATGSCNGVGACGPGSTGLIAESLATRFSENQEAGSLNTDLFHNNHLSAEVFWGDITEFLPTGGNTLGEGLHEPATNEHVSLADTEIFSPNLFNEIRTGYTYIRNSILPTTTVTAASVGETKWDAATQGAGIPDFTFTGGSNAQSFGGQNTNDTIHGGSASITLTDTLAWTHGKHTIRWGFEMRRYRWNYDNEYATVGAINFPDFGSFLTGTANRLIVNVGDFYRSYRATDLVGFVQDDFHVTRRLTLNLGLRYDNLGNGHDTKDRITNLDTSLIPAACIGGGGGQCIQSAFVTAAGAPGGIGTPGVSNNTITTPNNRNFAPRVGFAVDVLGNGKLSVRGGYGMYYIRTAGTLELQADSAPPWTESYLVSGTAVEGSKILANPWPAGLLQPSAFPVFPTFGRFQGTFASNGTPIFVDPNGNPVPLQSLDGYLRAQPTPNVQQWNLNVQAAILPGWVLEVGYIGSHAVHLQEEGLENQALLVSPSNPITYTYTPSSGPPVVTKVSTNSNNNAALRVPNLGFSPSGMIIATSEGSSVYDAMIVEVRHPFAKNFQFKFDYTWSKSIDDVSSDYGNGLGNQLLAPLNRGLSDFNQPQRFVFTYVWDLPRFRSGWRNTVLGGWSLSGVYTLQSGLPFSISDSTAAGLYGATGGTTLRGSLASCSGPVIPSGPVASQLNDYVNPTCFTPTPNLPSGTVISGITPQGGPGSGSITVGPTGPGDPGTGSLFGNSPRNDWHGPFDQRFDVSLVRSFPIRKLGEAGALQFRAEAFKLFNNVNFANPATNISSLSTFGKISSTLDSTGRILQLGLKLNF